MNKKVIIVSHRGILNLNGMNNETHYSKCLETFFSNNYDSFPTNKKEKAPAVIFIAEAKELIKKYSISKKIKIEDDWGLDKVYAELFKSVEQDKREELRKWYANMNAYSAPKVDLSIICEDMFDDSIEEKHMTVKNRCSVWKHKESNDDFAFYAVFPLRSANKDWPQTLINAVKEINQNPIEEILLLLHDHDLYNNYTPFHLDDSLSKSLSNCNEQKITLAVFQHINKEMSFLVNEQHSPKEIFNHYSEILGEKQKILDASSNDIVYKGYHKKLKKNIIDDNQ